MLKRQSILILFLTLLTATIYSQSEHDLKIAVKKSAGWEKARYLYRLGKLYQKGNAETRSNPKKSLKYYQEASSLSYDSAQYELGLAYEYGQNGVAVNAILAWDYYDLAAKNNNIQALFALANMYHKGAAGIEKNNSKAVAYYLLAWDLGHNEAPLALDNMDLRNLEFEDAKIHKLQLKYLASKGYNRYIYGFAVLSEEEKEYRTAFNYYSKAAAQDYWLAYYKLGTFYQAGWHVSKDMRQAVIEHLKAANHNIAQSKNILKTLPITQYVAVDNLDYLEYTADTGDINSQFKLYRLYAAGKSVPKDISKALSYCQQAAKNHHQEAMYILGQSYKTGILTDQNHDNAFKWFRKAAYRGHSRAKYELANMYLEGHDTNITAEKRKFWAIKWYLSAANDGVEEALLKLGNYNIEQYISNSDLEYVTYKAQHGDRAAQFKLGLYKLNQSNDSSALGWLEKAAKSGKVRAYIELAEIYAKGKCAQAINYSEAYKWYVLANRAKLKDRRLNVGLANSFFKSKQYRLETITPRGVKWSITHINIYKRILTLNKRQVPPAIFDYLGDLYVLDSNYSEAITAYSNYVKFGSSDSLKCEPTLVQALKKRALAYQTYGDEPSYKNALIDVEYALLLFKDCGIENKNLEAELYYIVGDLNLLSDDKSKACQNFAKAEKLGYILKQELKNVCNSKADK